MKLHPEMWDSFHVYISVDRKLSEKISSLSANKSRFRTITTYFSDKEFTRENFNLFIAEMVKKKYAASYINNMVKMGKHIDKFYNLNQLQDYTYFRENKRLPKDVLTAEEIRQLAEVTIQYAKHSNYINQRQKAIIYLLGCTGMRIGELLSLRWPDISTTTHFAYITLTDTKNGDSRQIPIGKLTHALLLALPRRSEFVFCSARGGAIEAPQINLDLKKRATAIGLQKKVFCHLFRHSFVTELLQDGVELSDVSMLAGHKDPRNTMRYKHTALDHYYDVLTAHPLLRDDMNFQMVAKRLTCTVNKLVNSKDYDIRIDETSSKIVIIVEQRPM